MDISLVIVLWIIIAILQAINDRKKAPPPPQDLDFEIPTLKQSDEFEEFDIEEIYKRRKQAEKNNSAAMVQSETVEEKKSELDLTPDAMMNAIIMSEILDKPKSLRRKKF